MASLPAEWILPAARRRARWECGCEIVEHGVAQIAVDRRHLVLLGHPVERVAPLLPGLPLLGDDLETVTGDAGIERLLAARRVRIVLLTLFRRREGLRGRGECGGESGGKRHRSCK